MKQNNIFSIRRLYLLIRRYVLSNTSGLFIAFGGLAGTLMVISLLVAYFNPANLPGLIPFYLSIMFIGGYIFTSNIFSELDYPRRAHHYLTLPVSVTERLGSAWIVTGILYPLLAFLSIGLIVFVANLIMNFAFDLQPFQGVFSQTGLNAIRTYLVTQSVFLLGAAYFRKNNFLKTLLAMFVVGMVLAVITGLFGWMLLSPYVPGGEFSIGPGNLSAGMESLFMNTIPATARILFNYLAVPFFLAVTWFTLKEREV